MTTGLREMQQLTTRLWSPSSFYTAGGLAWGRVTAKVTDEPVQIWREDDVIVAWGWLQGASHLICQHDPSRPELAHEIVAWFERTANGRTLTGEILETDVALPAALIDAGFVTDDDAPFSLDMRRPTSDPPTVDVPDGYAVRSISASDAEERVRVHRAAWEPSGFTTDRYARVRATWPYREDLDLVAVAPDGSFGACCIAWLDPDTTAAEIEPVGTDPKQRLLGLASAVCAAAISRAGDLGATEIVVHPRGDTAYPVPRMVYRRLGFDRVNRGRAYRKIS